MLLVCSCKQPRQLANNDLTNYLNQLSNKDLSGVVLVAQNDSILFEEAFGKASIEHNVDNSVHHRFNIASITKMFTAVATLKLYQEGKLDLHATVGTYLPDFPNATVRDSVTAHQLLTHSSGLNNFYVGPFESLDKRAFNKVADFVPLFAKEQLLSSPGEQYNYSASGFVVLGLLIEAISGQDYYSFLEQNIFKPSQMQNTFAPHPETIVSNIASGYTTHWGELDNPIKNDFMLSKASPGGFYYASAQDLLAFSKALRHHQLLKKETYDLMMTPKIKGYNTEMGYGVDIDNRYSQTISGHSGGWYGIRTELMDFKDKGYTVVVLSNFDDDGTTGASKVIDSLKTIIAGPRSNP